MSPAVDGRRHRATLKLGVGGLILVVAIMLGAPLSAEPIDDAVSKMKSTAEECRKKGTHPFDCFTEQAHQDWAFCGFAVHLAIMQRNYASHRRCAEGAKAAVAPLYEQARLALASNKTATDLLKDAYAYWLASLDRMFPGFEESKNAHSSRLAEEERTLEQKLNRLKLEKSS
jgi:hypothetical protein